MIDYDKVLGKKASSIKPSGIRKFFDIVAQMKDAISLGVGEPDFETPYKAKRAAINSIEMGKTFYTSNWGLIELRREIAKYLKNTIEQDYCPDDEIVVTVGGSEAIDNALRAFVDEGDEVLIPEPSFVCYSPLATLAGGKAIPIETKASDDFRLTKEALLEKITDKTKVLIMPFPNNPTGGIMKREHLEEIAEVIRGTNIIILSDEIYSELTYSGAHVSIAQMEGMRERTLVINGFSKAFAMTGWRLGYVAGPRELIAPLIKIHQFGIMSAPTMSQFAGISAIKECLTDTRNMRDEYNLRRKYLLNEMKGMGLDCFTPEGAFYIFPSIKSTGLTSEEFCERLLEEQKVAVVPGNAFGDSGEGHIRISYSYSMEHLKEAIKRMKVFLKQFEQK